MKPHMRILLGCATALLLTGAGSDCAFAYDVSVKNTTTEKVNIISVHQERLFMGQISDCIE